MRGGSCPGRLKKKLCRVSRPTRHHLVVIFIIISRIILANVVIGAQAEGSVPLSRLAVRCNSACSYIVKSAIDMHWVTLSGGSWA
jgi:hypothetical protein